MSTGLEETPFCDVCFYYCARHALKSKTYRRRHNYILRTAHGVPWFATISASVSTRKHITYCPFIDYQRTIFFSGILTIEMKTAFSLWPWFMALKRILGFESLSTIVASVIDSTRTHMVCLNMIPHIGRNLRLEITISAAVHSVCILKDLCPKPFLKTCNQTPLWYLLLWRCQAFFEEQNLEQRGQV